MSKKGFTLIELLVVIAIIGILASVVMVSLGKTKEKAKAGAIKMEMDQVRLAAEMSYNEKGNYNDVCAETGGTSGDSILSQTVGSDFKRLNDSIKDKNGNVNVTCNEGNLPPGTDSVSYAAWTPLPYPPGYWFCVDSTGAAKEVSGNTPPGINRLVCP